MCGYLRKGKVWWGSERPCVMFRTPSSIVMAGPSGCGKTYFMSQLLEEPGHYFQSGPPPALHYCYGAWQPGFEPLKKRGIHFHEGLPQTADLDTWYPPEGGLLILVDLMEEGGNDKRVLDLFTKHSHHRHITVLYLCQDLFPPGKYAKTILRNAHYVVAFKNPRDQLGIRNLMMQALARRPARVRRGDTTVVWVLDVGFASGLGRSLPSVCRRLKRPRVDTDLHSSPSGWTHPNLTGMMDALCNGC